MDSEKKNPQILEDVKINVKMKLSSLWVSVMFCYIYGDFFTLFVPGRIESLMNGNSGVGTTTPLKLLMFAILMTIPAIMVFLSLILKPTINRWTNISFGIFFTVVMMLVVATSIDKWMLFYSFLGVTEILITLLIVWQAWTWPKQDNLRL